MPIFSTQLSYLGVDFNARSVKVVEFKNEKGRPKLITYGYFDHEVDYQADKNKDNLSEIATLISATCKKAKTTTKTVISALPSFSVFNSIITLPPMSKKELSSAVNWEAKKVIPLSLAEMNLHWSLLEPVKEEAKDDPQKNSQPTTISKSLKNLSPQPADKAGDKLPQNQSAPKKFAANYQGFLKIPPKKEAKENIKILLTAAPKNLVKKYIAIFAAAGLNLLSLDTETFALIRSLIGNDRSTIMLVDIDLTVSNISIVQNGIPYLNRSVNVGGLTITRAIANGLNIGLRRAEQLKYDIGIGSPNADSKGIPKTIASALQPVIDEIKYSINLYKNQGGQNPEKIILTGGSAFLVNLPNYLSNLLSIRVYLGDPWARVIYPAELKPALSEVGPRFSVAIGLAMKEIV